MASVFGSTRVPKYHNGTADINLWYATVLEDAPQPDIRTFESLISGYRSNDVRGYRWRFSVRINLWKATVLASAWLDARLGEIGETDHRIARFGDDDYLRIDGSNYCYFTLIEVNPGFLTQSRDKDIVIMTWESNDYVDLTQNL